MRLVIHGHQLGVPRDAQAFLRKHLVRPIQRLHDNPDRCILVGAYALGKDLHAALLDAARRLRRLVEREVGKQRSTSRSPMHKPLGRSWRGRATQGELAPDGSPSTL